MAASVCSTHPNRVALTFITFLFAVSFSALSVGLLRVFGVDMSTSTTCTALLARRGQPGDQRRTSTRSPIAERKEAEEHRCKEAKMQNKAGGKKSKKTARLRNKKAEKHRGKEAMRQSTPKICYANVSLNRVMRMLPESCHATDPLKFVMRMTPFNAAFGMIRIASSMIHLQSSVIHLQLSMIHFQSRI